MYLPQALRHSSKPLPSVAVGGGRRAAASGRRRPNSTIPTTVSSSTRPDRSRIAPTRCCAGSLSLHWPTPWIVPVPIQCRRQQRQPSPRRRCAWRGSRCTHSSEVRLSSPGPALGPTADSAGEHGLRPSVPWYPLRHRLGCPSGLREPLSTALVSVPGIRCDIPLGFEVLFEYLFHCISLSEFNTKFAATGVQMQFKFRFEIRSWCALSLGSIETFP
ncbi:uncharacterized protein [Miscanthus floridulus]|uniref:uncharacterized protein n=1 Tax=Miscanthus floridulus TaxID=154761 RepID=UPI0034596D92